MKSQIVQSICCFVISIATSLARAQSDELPGPAGQLFKAFSLPTSGQYSGNGVTTLPNGQTTSFQVKPTCGFVPIVRGIQGSPSNPSFTTAQCLMTITTDSLPLAEMTYDCGAVVAYWRWTRSGNNFTVTSRMTGAQLGGQTVMNRMQLEWTAQCTAEPVESNLGLMQALNQEGQRRCIQLKAAYQKERDKPNVNATVMMHLERTRAALECPAFDTN
jgi:hypothetical protein